ncbi:MAG: hypothetical protein WCP82_05035 [Alphaproteobacteria bacterium]
MQSTTIAHMVAEGEITPMLDCAIVADTGAEGAAFYEHLAWLKTGNVLPFPIHTVSAGNIVDDLEKMTRGERWASIPAWVKGSDGREAPIRRQCTKEYKIEPIIAQVREMVGFKPGQSFRHALKIGPKAPVPTLVTQWLGISWDEKDRMAESEEAWIKNRWPLVEMKMTRQDCIQWLKKKGYPVPPKSACVFCPYTENQRWREMRDTQPAEWQKALEIDQLIAKGAVATDTRAGTQPMFLHRSLKRLKDVDLTDLFYDAGGMGNECSGHCER